MSRNVTLPEAARVPVPDRHVLALEEVRLKGTERATILGAAALALAFLGWAAVTRLPEIAVAPGQVETTLAAAPVQHLEGGIVGAVLVREGEMVAEGQPMLRLHDTAQRAELDHMRVRLSALRLQGERLAALEAGGELPLRDALAEILAGPQRAALEARLGAQAARRATLAEQIEQRRSEIATLTAQGAALERQLLIFRDEFATRQGLARDGLTTRIALLEAHRLVLGAEAERERVTGQVTTAGRALMEAQARLAELHSAMLDEGRAEAARIAQEIAETEAALGRLEDRAERMLLRAPSAGLVRGLAVTRPGSVLQPGAVVAEILPADAALLVEARITPRDIGFIVPGQPVTLKVQAFDFSRFGTVEGQVERISAGAFLDEQRQPFWRARIALAQAHVGADPGFARLAPGMTVSAEITTGWKTVLQYLLKPLHNAAATAFRER